MVQPGHLNLNVDLFQIRDRSPSEQTALFKKRIEQGLNQKVHRRYKARPPFCFPWIKVLAGSFNRLYWDIEKEYTKAIYGTEGDFRSAIGGAADTDPKVLEYLAGSCLDRLEAAVRADPDSSNPFYYFEAGVASVDYVERFLAYMAALAHQQGRSSLLDRLQYVLTDFSKPILEDAEKTLGKKFGRVSLIYSPADAENPNEQLEAYKGRILGFHATNIFDNIPSVQIARRNGFYYQVRTRLYLPLESYYAIVRKYDHNSFL